MKGLIRIYADEHISPRIVLGLRRRGIDVVTTAEAGNLGVSDANQLSYAKRNGRALLTHDADFLRLHVQGIEHSGILFSKQTHSIGKVIRSITLISQLLDAEELDNHIEFI